MHKICVDKLLPTRSARLSAAKMAIAENPDNLPATPPKHPLSLALETEKRWAIGRILNVYFMEGSATQKRRVEETVQSIDGLANIHFRFTENPKSEIRIKFDQNEGSWSYIGTDALVVPFKQPTVNFGWLDDDTDQTEYNRVVYHELAAGHTLGNLHEHNSPAAGIKWNKPVVYKYFKGPPNGWSREDVDINLFYTYDKTLTQYSSFDPLSIMCYAIPAEFTLDGFSVPWNTNLSETDKKYLGIFYPFGNIKLDGTPRVLKVPANAVKELDLVVSEAHVGKYEVEVSPPHNSWVSVKSAEGAKVYGKDKIEVDLSAGESKIKVRNEKKPGRYEVSVKRV